MGVLALWEYFKYCVLGSENLRTDKQGLKRRGYHCLTSKIQMALGPSGLIPFKALAGLIYPYHIMTVEQKIFLRVSLEDRTIVFFFSTIFALFSTPP